NTESYSEALSSKESVQEKKAIIEEIVSLEKNQTCSIMKDICSEKHVLGYVLTVGVTTVEWESRLQKSITIYTKSSIHLAKNPKDCSWAKLVRILISEGSISLLKILGTKSLAAMFTRLVMKEKLKFCVASTGL
ncbi:hypothetical protein Tco_0585074, partial [Tanacetum coccineum]